MRDYELGRNESRRDDSFEYGMTASFRDVAALDAYLTSERHEAFVADCFKPLIRHRAIVSFEAGADTE